MADKVLGKVALLAELKDNISPNLKKIKTNTEKTTGVMKSGFKGVKSSIDALAASQFLDTMGDKLIAWGKRAGDVEHIEDATRKLTEALGIQKDKMIEHAQEGVDGLVTKYDLMTTANSAMLLGVVQSETDFTELTESAYILSSAIGISARDGMNSLIEAVGRGSTEMLDNLGVSLKMGQAYKIWADQNKRTVKSMTDVEKKSAFMTIALQKVKAKAQELGPVVSTTNDKLDQFKVYVQDVTDGLSGTVGPLATVGGGVAEVGAQLALISTMAPKGLFSKMGAGLTVMKGALMGPLGVAALMAAVVIAAKGLNDTLREKEISEFMSGVNMDNLPQKVNDVAKEIENLTERLADPDIKQYPGLQGQINERLGDAKTRYSELTEYMKNEYKPAMEESTAATIEHDEATEDNKEALKRAENAAKYATEALKKLKTASREAHDDFKLADQAEKLRDYMLDVVDVAGDNFEIMELTHGANDAITTEVNKQLEIQRLQLPLTEEQKRLIDETLGIDEARTEEADRLKEKFKEIGQTLVDAVVQGEGLADALRTTLKAEAMRAAAEQGGKLLGHAFGEVFGENVTARLKASILGNIPMLSNVFGAGLLAAGMYIMLNPLHGSRGEVTKGPPGTTKARTSADGVMQYWVPGKGWVDKAGNIIEGAEGQPTSENKMPEIEDSGGSGSGTGSTTEGTGTDKAYSLPDIIVRNFKRAGYLADSTWWSSLTDDEQMWFYHQRYTIVRTLLYKARAIGKMPKKIEDDVPIGNQGSTVSTGSITPITSSTEETESEETESQEKYITEAEIRYYLATLKMGLASSRIRFLAAKKMKPTPFNWALIKKYIMKYGWKLATAETSLTNSATGQSQSGQGGGGTEPGDGTGGGGGGGTPTPPTSPKPVATVTVHSHIGDQVVTETQRVVIENLEDTLDEMGA